ncbi:hypothetical protein [Methanococcus voltae]|uniref:Uncharacterized protein n=1 Tax=Methanococcus voltae (strain ATCC BAA-1334 / A3) TaxID=456320 RepID=D7DSF5_METV3|nr:hypothetical protein [Methanococcus voltae]MCS3901591.1 hypothetical protein [Methanococcus voltae]
MIKYSKYYQLLHNITIEFINSNITVKSQFNPKISDYLFEMEIFAKPNFDKKIWNIELILKTKQFHCIKLNSSKIEDINSKIDVLENILQKYDLILNSVEYNDSELNLIFKTNH